MEEVHSKRCTRRAPVPRTTAKFTQDYGERGRAWECNGDGLQFPYEVVYLVQSGEGIMKTACPCIQPGFPNVTMEIGLLLG